MLGLINDDGKFKIVAGTACQYTGIRDRRKSEIYEEAIMAWDNGIAKQEYRNSLWRVYWDEGSACFSLILVAGLYTDTPFFKPHWPSNMEVIGDTFTTPPELLKEAEKK